MSEREEIERLRATPIEQTGGVHYAAIMNTQLETSVLACGIVENELIDLIATRCEEDDFFAYSNRIIFAAMVRMHERRHAVDHTTLREELMQRGQLANVGGDEYLFSLTNTLPNTSAIETYVTQLAAVGQKRRFVSACRDAAAGASQPEHAEDGVAWGMRTIIEATKTKDSGAWGGDAMNVVRASMQKFHKGVEHRRETGSSITGTTTGLNALDNLTGGMMNGEVVCVAGRPGMGKTAFALNMATASIFHPREPRFCPIFSLEMPKEQIGDRLICMEGRISASRWRRGDLIAEELTKLQQTITAFDVMNDGRGPSMYVYDKPGVTIEEMRVIIHRERRKWEEMGIKLGPIFVDYLQLMRCSNERQPREQQISEISRGLKSMAKEEGTTVVEMSQLNRSVESRSNKSKRPQLSDLRESGAIEQDADTVWFLYRDEIYNRDTTERGVAEVIVAKHRSAATGTARVAFMSDYGLFYDFAHNDVRGAPRDGIYDDHDDNAGF